MIPVEWNSTQAAELVSLWSACLASPTATTNQAPLKVVPSGSAAMYSYNLGTSLTKQAITSLRGELLMLHGCALANEDGATIACIAPSGTGKSTLVRTAGRHFQYVTDELVGVEASGRVRPYPKPLSHIVRPETHGKEDSSLATHSLTPAENPLHLQRIIFLRRDPGQHEAVLSPVPLAQAIHRAVEQTSSLWEIPWGLQSLIDYLTVGGQPLELVYAESASAVEVLRQLLASPASAASPDQPLPHGPRPEFQLVPPSKAPAAGQLGHHRDLQACWIEDELLILQPGGCNTLSPAAAMLWQHCSTPTNRQDLIASLLADDIATQDDIPAINAAIDALLEASLLAEPGREDETTHAQ